MGDYLVTIEPETGMPFPVAGRTLTDGVWCWRSLGGEVLREKRPTVGQCLWNEDGSLALVEGEVDFPMGLPPAHSRGPWKP